MTEVHPEQQVVSWDQLLRRGDDGRVVAYLDGAGALGHGGDERFDVSPLGRQELNVIAARRQLAQVRPTVDHSARQYRTAPSAA